MIQLGHLTVIFVVLILYVLWSYYSWKDINKQSNKPFPNFNEYTAIYMIFHIITIIIGLLILVSYYIIRFIEYLNKYQIL